LVLLVGLCLFMLREELVPAEIVGEEVADGESAGEVVPVEAGAEPVAAPEVAVPKGPEWTPEKVASHMTQLPGLLESWIDEGLGEVRRFRGMEGNDPSARALRNQWASWRQVWANRLGKLRGEVQPPMGKCLEQVALVDVCVAVDGAIEQLEEIAEAPGVEDAKACLEGARKILDDLYAAREKAAEEARLAAEAAAEAEAAENGEGGTGGADAGDDQSASDPP
jgi:hypothetical protein